MNQGQRQISDTFEWVLIALLIALTIVSARLNFALGPIPITMQPFVVLLSGVLIGPRRGWLVPAIYLVMGLAGIPVFVKGGGIGYIVEPTFGFLVGFIPGAWVAGFCANPNRVKNYKLRVIIGATLGIIVIYGCGLGYIPIAGWLNGSKWVVMGKILASLPVMLVGDLLKIIFLTSLAPILQKELTHIRQNMVPSQASL